MSPEESRALQIALFSLLPGLGQLINRRADKAIAFFIVDILNVVIVSVFARVRIPFVEFYSADWDKYMYHWQVGSAPFAVLMFLIAAYVSYAMYDAYKDAVFDLCHTADAPSSPKASSYAALRAIEPQQFSAWTFNKRWRKPLVSLSLITCLSYIAHLGTIMLTCFLVLLKVFPLEPVVQEHAIEFVIADLDNSNNARDRGQGQNSDKESNAHSPDPLKDQLSAASKVSESGNRIDDERKDATSKETEQISSKEIITPETKQSPREVRSLGASNTAKQATKTQDSQTQTKKAAAIEKNLRSSQSQQLIKTEIENGNLPSGSESNKTASRDPIETMSKSAQSFVNGGMARLADQSKVSSSSYASSSSSSSSPSSQLASISFLPGISGNRVPDPSQRPVELVSVDGPPLPFNGPVGVQEKAVSISMLPGPTVKATQQVLRPFTQSTRLGHHTNAGHYTTYQGSIDNSLSGDKELNSVWSKYFHSFQAASDQYKGELDPGRSEAEFIFDSNGKPVSYNISNASGPSSESLSSIIDQVNMAALPALPAKFAGKLSVKVGLIHSGRHTIGTFDISPMPTMKGRIPSQAQQIKSTSKSGEPVDSRTPSMLGFMDESLSSEPAMQHFWSEYSKVLSHAVRDRATDFSNGSTIASFAVDRNGQAQQINLTNPQSQISRELSQVLSSLRTYQEKLPTLPANHVGKTYMAVKLSTKNDKPFVSIEIQPNPISLNSESLEAFETETQLQAYLQDLKKVIYRSWTPRSKEGAKPVMVGFHIATNGKLSNHKVVQSSGDPETDKAALEAALAVTDWVAPPAGTEEDLDISMVIQNCTPCDETKSGQNANKKFISLPEARELNQDRWRGFVSY